MLARRGPGVVVGRPTEMPPHTPPSNLRKRLDIFDDASLENGSGDQFPLVSQRRHTRQIGGLRGHENARFGRSTEQLSTPPVSA